MYFVKFLYNFYKDLLYFLNSLSFVIVIYLFWNFGSTEYTWKICIQGGLHKSKYNLFFSSMQSYTLCLSCQGILWLASEEGRNQDVFYCPDKRINFPRNFNVKLTLLGFSSVNGSPSRTTMAGKLIRNGTVGAGRLTAGAQLHQIPYINKKYFLKR